MDRLTPKQKAFADNYIENGGNATARSEERRVGKECT